MFSKRAMTGIAFLATLALGGVAGAAGAATPSGAVPSATSTTAATAPTPSTAPIVHGRKVLEAAATAIGISYKALLQALHGHETIGAIAAAHGVSRGRVIAAMVSVAERDFDAAARARRVDPRYRAMIPRIIASLVGGSGDAHHAKRRGVQAKALFALRLANGWRVS